MVTSIRPVLWHEDHYNWEEYGYVDLEDMSWEQFLQQEEEERDREIDDEWHERNEETQRENENSIEASIETALEDEHQTWIYAESNGKSVAWEEEQRLHTIELEAKYQAEVRRQTAIDNEQERIFVESERKWQEFEVQMENEDMQYVLEVQNKCTRCQHFHQRKFEPRLKVFVCQKCGYKKQDLPTLIRGAVSATRYNKFVKEAESKEMSEEEEIEPAKKKPKRTETQE